MSAAKKRLTELERLEIINQLERKNPLSKLYFGKSRMLVKVQLEKFGRIEMKLKDDLLTCLSKEKAKS